jgi:hypothetical protein
MEDYHTAEVKEVAPGRLAGCFAIYDGHGGRQCVQFVQKRLFKAILTSRAFSDGDINTAVYQGYMQVRAVKVLRLVPCLCCLGVVMSHLQWSQCHIHTHSHAHE